ncbi:MAG: J domain-containing protein [Cyanobacteria bacterium P01_A01_bin.135]
MDLATCYRLLELPEGATVAQVKASYRRLARQLHPDVSVADASADRFIQLTDAYKALVTALATSQPHTAPPVNAAPPPAPAPPVSPPLSNADRKLKRHVYSQLQACLKNQRFARAVTLSEALAQRLPGDSEVRQWQAIAYQRWGRALITTGEETKAKGYLKKALRTDPNNRALWSEVERDLRRLDMLCR